MRERVLVLDGATGTALQARHLTAEDYGGPELDGCIENLVHTRPDVVVDLHRAYLAAGADIIETNTFGASPLVLGDYGLADQAHDINYRAAQLACRAVEGIASMDRPRFVAGSIGPTNKAISVTGGATFAELEAGFAVQARGLAEGGVDIFLVETCQDTRNTKAAINAVRDVLSRLGIRRPLWLSATIELSGTMLAGQTIDAFAVSVAHSGCVSIGLNCATGPEFMADHIRALQLWPMAVSCYPNAGLPGPDGRYPESPESLAAALERLVDNGWLNIVGGCCGTTESHIRAISQMVQGKSPRRVPSESLGRTFFSGTDVVEPTDQNRPLLVGERTNVLGSREFRQLVADGAWDDAAEVARRQVASGAQILDVCLQSAERDEVADIAELYKRLVRKVRVPLMIDATRPAAIEQALTYCQGKAIVNSVNLEDGGRRLEKVCPLLTRYGAAAVVGAIDDDPVQAQALTRERKLEVLRRAHELLTRQYGIPEEDIVLDPLVFPAASGDSAYVGSAVETLASLRMIKSEFPRCKTILGISNVSFGLPPAARHIVNSVFLYLATQAGLDLAIVNTERVERYASLDPEDRRSAEDLLANRPPRAVDTTADEAVFDAPTDWRQQPGEVRNKINRLHIQRLSERFRDFDPQRQVARHPELPLDERLTHRVVEGSRAGLIEDLDLKLAEGASPLEIINGPLMDGMAEVGRLFADNQLIVAEVLESAEVMRAAVTHLECHLPSAARKPRGKVVLATVKGDVHDIGKNLVDIVLTNNGYEVIDLGIRVPPEVLIRSVRDHDPDAIGLSGLLVRSAHEMAGVAEDLREAGVQVPLLVGGAALSRAFTEERIAPAYGADVFYCEDAMGGLAVLERVRQNRAARQKPSSTPAKRGRALSGGRKQGPQARGSSPTSSSIRLADGSRAGEGGPRPAPYPERRVLTSRELSSVWQYLNLQRLYGKHLGFPGNFERALAEQDPTAMKLRRQVESTMSEVQEWLEVRAVWRFLSATSENNEISLYDPESREVLEKLELPRQKRPPRLCLADYVFPPRGRVMDSIAAFVVTAGHGVAEQSTEAKRQGRLLASHTIQALAIETAEAAAEWLHSRLRRDWGIVDAAERDSASRRKGRHAGRRYSFGYPACPDLAGQEALWRLLRPEEIGVELTEGMMMEPEASVSAIVFHHPEARYFSVTDASLA